MASKNVQTMILVFLLSIVGLALTPTVSEYIADITHANNGTAGFPAGGNNLTGGARSVMAMFPLFWVILMIAIPVSYVGLYLRG